MKTLVIHPKDTTTDFLKEIYLDKPWTIINEDVSEKYLKEQIKEHDRIIMLGHGAPYGLLGYGRFVIDPSFVYLLKEKDCVCIWCNADRFVEKYGLKGFYTGMIISEPEEATCCGIQASDKEIFRSNYLFANIVKNAIDGPNMLKEMKENYHNDNSPIIVYNRNNLYDTQHGSQVRKPKVNFSWNETIANIRNLI